MGIKAIADVLTGKRKLRWIDVAIPVLFVFYTVMRAIDRVFNTRIGKILQNPVYVTVYQNIVFTVGLLIAQTILSVGYILIMRFYHKDKRYGVGFLSPVSELASTSGRYSQFLLFLFIVGDQLNALIGMWGIPKTDQTMQNLLSQFTLVFTVIFAYIFLKTRYHQVHYIACVLVIMSTLQAVTVEVQTSNPPLGEYKGNDGYHKTSIIYILLVFISTIPAAGGNVFKQWCLQGVGAKYGELDVMYASFWSSIWQICFAMALIPTMWIKFPGVASIEINQTREAFRATFVCFFGGRPSSASLAQQELCASPTGSAFEWFCIYSIFNLSYNVSFLYLTKYMSTTWTQIANVIVFALSSIVGTSPALMGESAQSISFEQWLGIILGVISLWLYTLEDEVDVNGEQVFLIHKMKQERSTGGDAVVDVACEDDVESPAFDTYSSNKLLTRP
eukprot:CAMPEP_0203765632 /NCGR_PEP_ID=MMETSP0098-20131031/18516_1 /ASSEMBLY_ACC=CAM_ASM_000208 /TAXON_ID=96639 /ORGANISM=" , Strain NY0313808BC1" /LENGTH=445 /DNA_ID=CAMNT_0050661899 /DNA_START=1243 /DNA_END=2580 /DNA_ORIENTATION=+